MEKYGQYRDKGSGIAPFFEIIPETSSPLLVPWHMLLFCLRIPFLALAWLIWLLLVQWLPAGSVLRKANQWCLLGVPGVWWIDLQVDGVRRGSLAKGSTGRLPGPGTIIASSFTSPLDVLYLAAIFDPVFSIGQAGSRKVRPVSLEGALAACFDVINPLELGSSQTEVELAKLNDLHPNRVVVVFPEGTTSNGRGILRLTPALLSAKKETKIYPLSLRYTPADIVTPMPGWLQVLKFIWRLNSRQSHCIRVRVGGHVTVAGATSGQSTPSDDKTRTDASRRTGYEINYFDTLEGATKQEVIGHGDTDDEDSLDESEKATLDVIADTLARLGRVKRVGLGVEEKEKFVEAWTSRTARRS